MPQSLTKVYVHLVFSTKGRVPRIRDEMKDELFDYLGGICNNLECYPVRVGGHRDHIHILCILSKKIALMKALEEIKKSSSKWIKSRWPDQQNFFWQNGYGAFSVNPAQIDVVVRYIDNQAEHHGRKSFQDECRTFFRRYRIEYDERYVWD